MHGRGEGGGDTGSSPGSDHRNHHHHHHHHYEHHVAMRPKAVRASQIPPRCRRDPAPLRTGLGDPSLTLCGHLGVVPGSHQWSPAHPAGKGGRCPPSTARGGGRALTGLPGNLGGSGSRPLGVRSCRGSSPCSSGAPRDPAAPCPRTPSGYHPRWPPGWTGRGGRPGAAPRGHGGARR